MAVTIDTAVETISEALKNMRELGHPVPQQLAFVKSKLYDESFLMRSDRNQVLKKVNRLHGVSWSMSQIKSANTETAENGETLIVAENGELKGSVSVNIGGQPLDKAFAGLGVKVDEPGEKQVKGIDVSSGAWPTLKANCEKFLGELEETFESLEQLQKGGWLLKALDKNNDKVTYTFTAQGIFANRGYVEMAEEFINNFQEVLIPEIQSQTLPEHIHQAAVESVKTKGPAEETHKEESHKDKLTRVLQGKGVNVILILDTIIGGPNDHFVLCTAVQKEEGEPTNWIIFQTKGSDCEVSQFTHYLPDDIVEQVKALGAQPSENRTLDMELEFAFVISHIFNNLADDYHRYFNEKGITTTPVFLAGEPQTKNSNTQPEGSTAMNDHIPQNLKSKFEGFLLALGKSPEDREVFIRGFLESSEAYKNGYATFKVSNAHLNEVEALFLFAEENPEVATAIVDMAADKHLIEEGLKHTKSRFSLTGEDEEAGPRGGWIGFGAAVVGGGIEMFARDGATVGAAIGTLGAAVGSFLGGELVDKYVDNRLGRYVAAGMMGMGAGSLGSAIGRNLITGVQMPDFIIRTVNGELGAAVVSDADL